MKIGTLAAYVSVNSPTISECAATIRKTVSGTSRNARRGHRVVPQRQGRTAAFARPPSVTIITFTVDVQIRSNSGICRQPTA